MASFPLTDAIKNSPMYNGWNKNDGSIEADFAAHGNDKYESYLLQGGTPLSQDPGALAIQNSPKVAQQQYMNQANALQQMQIQANQPSIATLQGQETNLGSAYTSLLNSVLTGGTVAENQYTTAENNLLGQRGITNDSPLYGQQMGSALLPVESQYKTLAANVGMGSAQDINTLAGQIASLQAGNVPQALTTATSLAGLQEAYAANQLTQNTALQSAQLGFNKPQIATTQSGKYALVSPTGAVLSTGGGKPTTGIMTAAAKRLETGNNTSSNGSRRSMRNIANFVHYG